MQSLKKNWIVVSFSNLTWGIWWMFTQTHKSLKNCTLMGSFCQKHIMFQLGNFRGIMFMTLKCDTKFKGKLTCGLKNDIRNLVNFHASSQKSENLYFDVLLLSIAYKVSAWKVQNYLSWHWKEIQTLKKNWLFIWKMTWGIWWTLT